MVSADILSITWVEKLVFFFFKYLVPFLLFLNIILYFFLELKQARFRLGTSKLFPAVRVGVCWKRLPKEAVASPSLEGFKKSLDKRLSGMVNLELLLPLGWKMDWLTSSSLYQPYVVQFSFSTSQTLVVPTLVGFSGKGKTEIFYISFSPLYSLCLLIIFLSGKIIYVLLQVSA